MLIVLNYKDGETCVTFDEINETLKQKENPDNHNGFQGSPSGGIGGPSGIRTPDLPVMSRELWPAELMALLLLRHYAETKKVRQSIT